MRGNSALVKRQKIDHDGASTVSQQPSEWDKNEAGPVTKENVQRSIRTASKWDTPLRAQVGATPKRNRWDLTPAHPGQIDSSSRFNLAGGETPTPGRWAQPTPMRLLTETPSRFGATPSGG